MDKTPDISDLLATKLCHDLSGVIGAVHNGIEFLEEVDTEEMKAKSLELIATNGKEAIARLKFYRVMYGVTTDEGEADLEEIHEIAQHYFAGSKTNLNWGHNPEVSLTGRAVKLLFNMLYIGASVLLVGGEIDVIFNNVDKGKEIIVKATGERIKENEDIHSILDSLDNIGIKASNVQLHHTAKVAGRLGVKMKSEYTDNSFTLAAKF